MIFSSTEFSVWLCSSSFSCERIWFSIKISIFTWCVCVSCFGYEAVIRTSLDAFSEVRLRWHHRRRNVFKSCCLACIYVNIFCAYVLSRIWFLWCFCFYMSLRKSCGGWFSFRCPRDFSSFGYETMITFSTEIFCRICMALINVLSMFSDVPVMSLPSRIEIL